MDFFLNESPVPFLPLYLDESELFAVVDAEDYGWASQNLWRPKWDRHGRKAYATRSLDIREDNARVMCVTFYLHKQVCLLANGPPPTPRHTIGDHKDDNSLNCRRGNMRWATPKMNRQNVDGWFARQLQLQLDARVPV